MLPIYKVIKNVQNVFLAIGGLHKKKVMRHFTRYGTGQCQNSSSNLLTPYREQPRSTRIVVACIWQVFSATNSTHHSPTTFDRQAQVSHGRTSSCRHRVHGGGCLEPVKLAREPASCRPKPCAFLKNAPKILSVRRFLLALVGKKPTMVRNSFPLRIPPGSRL